MLPSVPCRYCGEPIVMVRTTKGHKMPLDPVPNDDGNVIVASAGGGYVAVVVGKDANPPIGTRMMPHFATCTEYDSKKRGKR